MPTYAGQLAKLSGTKRAWNREIERWRADIENSIFKIGIVYKSLNVAGVCVAGDLADIFEWYFGWLI